MARNYENYSAYVRWQEMSECYRGGLAESNFELVMKRVREIRYQQKMKKRGEDAQRRLAERKRKEGARAWSPGWGEPCS